MTAPDSFQAAVETLRRTGELLANAAPEEIADLLHLHRHTVALLEQCGRQRLASVALATRVAQIENTLTGRSAAERRRIVCQRLGIGKTRYYELRKIPQKSGPNA